MENLTKVLNLHNAFSAAWITRLKAVTFLLTFSSLRIKKIKISSIEKDNRSIKKVSLREKAFMIDENKIGRIAKYKKAMGLFYFGTYPHGRAFILPLGARGTHCYPLFNKEATYFIPLFMKEGVWGS